MKIRKSVILLTITLISLTGCVDQDMFVHWKELNEEWFEANKERTESFPFEWSIDVLKIEKPLVDSKFEISPTGLKYRALRLGNPTDKKPINPTSTVWTTYEGKLIDGTTFDKNTEAELPISNTIAGFQEILYKMHIGDIYEIYIPWNLGYKDQNSGKIPPYSTLIFRIELVKAVN